MLRSLAALAIVVLVGSGCPIVYGEGEAGEGEGEGAAEGEGEGNPGTPDGNPQRASCTSNFDNEVGIDVYGRLDGFLRAVINTGGNFDCRGDDDHLHLQVEAEGKIVDVAINLDVGIAEVDHAPVQEWSEGFHEDITFDYVRDLATHAAAFDDLSPSSVQSQVANALSSTNHITVYARGYANDGLHDVHRNGAQHDGVLVAKPTEATAHYVLFRFSDQAF